MKIAKGTISDNSLAERYDKLHSIVSEGTASAKEYPHLDGAHQVIISQLQDKSGKLLDVGCGRGELLVHAPAGFDTKIGVDLSEVFLKDAAEFIEKYAQEPEKINLIAHDLNEKWPFNDKYFDVIVSSACIEHVFDVYHLFREFNRCLKDDGYFYFSIPNIAYVKHRVRLLLGLQPVTASSMENWWRDYWDGTHLHYFTPGAVKMLCRQTGFEVVQMTGSGSHRNLRKWWPSLLCGDMIVTARKIKNPQEKIS